MSQSPPPPTQILGSLAIEQLNDLVYVFDRQFRLLYVNDTACRILGYAREELLAASAAVIGAADPTSQEAGIAPGWNIGEQYTAESALLARDGRVIPVEISARVIDHAGEPLRVVVARDIGERKHLEEKELAARAREFHTLVEHLPDVVVRYDLQLRRTYVNAAFHAVHGTTDEAVLGKLPGEGSRLTEPSSIALQELATADLCNPGPL